MMLDLEAIENRWKTASDAPWGVGIYNRERDPIDTFRENLSYGEGDVWLVWLPNHPQTVGTYPTPEHAVTVCITGNGPTSEANAYALAEAPNDVRDLLAEVRRLQKALEKVTLDAIGLEHDWSGANADAETYREALKFYAAKENYQVQWNSDRSISKSPSVRLDEGETARQALGEG